MIDEQPVTSIDPKEIINGLKIIIKSGDIEAVKKETQEILQTYESNHGVMLEVADLIRRLELTELSTKIYEQILNSETLVHFKWVARVGLARLAIHNRDRITATTHLIEAIKLCPDRPMPYIKLRIIGDTKEELEYGLARHNEVADEGSQVPAAHLGKGYIKIRLGRTREAVPHLRKGSWLYYSQTYPELFSSTDESDERSKPDFIILGLMKCGTTSLYNYIAEHSQVILPPRKELHYFDLAAQHSSYGFSLEEYLSYFPPVIKNKNFIIGEATPSYLTFNIQNFVAENLPDTKLIIIFRDPVERAVSHYFHCIRLGQEKRTINEALQNKIESFSLIKEMNLDDAYDKLHSLIPGNMDWKINNNHNKYMAYGFYDVFLENWLKVIPRERLLILNMADIKNDPAAVYKNVYSFLGIDSGEYKTESVNWNDGVYIKNISDDLKNQMREIYYPHMKRLKELAGIDFSREW